MNAHIGLLVLLALLLLPAATAKQEGLVVRKQANPADAAYAGGYVITAQFKCLDLLCPHWELDISALSHVTAIPDVLLTLVPKAPAANMNFPVFTAFDPATRRFTVLGVAAPDDVRLWTVTISADGKAATPLANATITLPATLGTPVSLHYVALGSSGGQARLFAILVEAYIIEIDVSTGKVISQTPILPGVSQATARSEGANVIDAKSGILYAALRTKITTQHMVVTFDLNANKPLANHSLAIPGDSFELESAFHAILDNSTNALYWLATGRFDQILRIDPTTGAGKPVIADMSQQNYFFVSNPTTHADDTFHVDAVDPVAKRVYMQVSTKDQGDDFFTTNFVYWNLGGEFFYEIYAPITFGLSGFQWVPTPQQ